MPVKTMSANIAAVSSELFKLYYMSKAMSANVAVADLIHLKWPDILQLKSCLLQHTVLIPWFIQIERYTVLLKCLHIKWNCAPFDSMLNVTGTNDNRKIDIACLPKALPHLECRKSSLMPVWTFYKVLMFYRYEGHCCLQNIPKRDWICWFGSIICAREEGEANLFQRKEDEKVG